MEYHDSDFSQGVYRGFEIVITQIENGHHPQPARDEVPALYAALEQIVADTQAPIDHYDRNGPTWTTPGGQEYEDTAHVLEKMRELQAIALAALALVRGEPSK